MYNNQGNSKKVRTLTADTLMPKSMSMGLKKAKYDNILRVRTLHVPLVCLMQPLSVISKQQNLWIKFTDVGMVTVPEVHKELIKFLLVSVKYN